MDSSSLILDVSESNQKEKKADNAEHIKRSWHICCFILNAILLWFFYHTIRCQLYINAVRDGHRSGDPENNSEAGCLGYVKDGGSMFTLPIAPYVFYMVECCLIGARISPKKKMKVVEYESFVNTMKASRPQLMIKVECWHLETRTKMVYYTDYEGRSQSRLETSQEIVISHTDFNTLNLKSWEDTTGDIMGVVGDRSVRLEVQKDYEFGDVKSMEKFEKMKEKIIQKNLRRDECINDYVIYEIDGYEERVMVQKNGPKEKLCTNRIWYWFWTLLGLSWPYRIWVENHLPNKRIKIKKTIYL